MRLFDGLFTEKLEKKFGAKRHEKPTIASLATDPRFMKEGQRIEDWFDGIPEKSKPNLKGRFISEDERQHLSVYNELVVDRFLRKNGIDHKFEPEIEEGVPDFLVKSSTHFYLEVASVFESRDLAREIRRLKALLDELNKIEHYFFLGIESYVIPDSLNYRDVKRFVKERMDGFDPSTLSEIEEITYDRDGLRLELAIIPSSRVKKGPIIGMSMFPVTWVTGENVRRALKGKLRKYKSIKEMGLPYVVALALEDRYVDLEDVVAVLFGKETVERDRNTLRVVKVGRDNSGLLTTRSRLETGVQNRRLSAVLVIRRKWFKENGNELRRHNFTVIHNPYAHNPLLHEIFDQYAQFVIKEENETGIMMGWTKTFDEYEFL